MPKAFKPAQQNPPVPVSPGDLVLFNNPAYDRRAKDKTPPLLKAVVQVITKKYAHLEGLNGAKLRILRGDIVRGSPQCSKSLHHQRCTRVKDHTKRHFANWVYGTIEWTDKKEEK